MIETILVMAYRQLKRFIRAKSRIASSLALPVIWLVLFGMTFARMLNFPFVRQFLGGLDYLSFLVPGVVAMTVFTASFTSGISVLWDRQFGFLKELLVAPAPRFGIMFGRVLGDSIAALIQGLMIALLGKIIAPHLNLIGLPLALLYLLLLSIGFTSFGVALAMKITSPEGFHAITSFIMLPLMFLCNTLYPLNIMPSWMRILSYANPLTYAVDGVRYSLTGVSTISPILDLTILVTFALSMTMFASYMFSKATVE